MPRFPTNDPFPRRSQLVAPSRSAPAWTRRGALALLAATIATTVAATLGASRLTAQDTRTVQFASTDVAVFNFVGTMRVVGSSGARAEAVISLRGSDRGTLTLAHNEVRGRETLRIRYPDRAIRSLNQGRSTMWVRDDGTWGGSGGRRGGRRVELSNSSNALDASADIELRVPRGTSARVYLLAGAVDVRNVEGELHVDVASATITSVGSRASLWLDTGSGDVHVSDAEGDLHLDTGSGSVTVQNARGTVLEADTGSGDVTLDGLTFDTGTFDTGSGALRATNATLRRASFDTGSGRVVGSFLNTPESIVMDSGSGDVTVELPANAGLTLDLSTSSGKITSDFPVAVSSQSRRSLRGTIGDGRGRLEIDSGSGDLRLQIRR